MKPFHDWVADYEQKFEDNSGCSFNPSSGRSLSPEPPKELTEWQIRAKMCSLIYPKIETSKDVTDWISLFCLKDDGTVYYDHDFHSCLGLELYKQHLQIETDEENVNWWVDLCISIENGTFDPTKG